MALEYKATSQTFTGTGDVTVYTVNFPVFAASHITVTGRTAAGAAFSYTQGVDYTVAIRQNAAGGYIGAIITLASPLPVDYKMTISRVVPIVQQSVFYNQGGMQPEVVERQLDYLTMICQQINSGKAAASHAHAIANITGLQAALNGKAPVSHTHTIANTTGLQNALDGKAPVSHTHTIANVTGLQAALTAANDRIAELENSLSRSMPHAPDDGRLYVAMGGVWYPLKLEMGEPFERVGDAVQPVVGLVAPTAIWDVGSEYTYTLKLTSNPGDSDSFFERLDVDTFVFKNIA